ncbi:hypothetical protein ACOSQ2_006516 [Xanthoceras sorbifolium]
MCLQLTSYNTCDPNSQDLQKRKKTKTFLFLSKDNSSLQVSTPLQASSLGFPFICFAAALENVNYKSPTYLRVGPVSLGNWVYW